VCEKWKEVAVKGEKLLVNGKKCMSMGKSTGKRKEVLLSAKMCWYMEKSMR